MNRNELKQLIKECIRESTELHSALYDTAPFKFEDMKSFIAASRLLRNNSLLGNKYDITYNNMTIEAFNNDTRSVILGLLLLHGFVNSHSSKSWHKNT